MFGVWNICFDPIPICINISIFILGLGVLVLAIIEKLRKKPTCLFEVAFLLFLVGFSFITIHAKLLQFIFPISLPEQPLIDNNLTYNYTLANLLAYLIFPILLLILMRSEVSLEKFGLKVKNLRKTIIYILFGSIFSGSLFLFTYYFFGFKWISGYTLDGLILWVLLVSVLSVFLQTFFFIGILFNKYSDTKYVFILAVISILAVQLFINASWPWIISNMVTSVAKILVTWRTRNIYGAISMGIIVALIENLIQIV